MVDVEKIIEEVRHFPVLYDQSNEKYRNSEYKDKIWKVISTKLEIEGGVEECKKKWSSVRDQLRRTLQKRKTKTGQAAFKSRKYKFEDILSFLVPYLGEREGLTNVPKLQDYESVDSEYVNVKQEDLTEEMSSQEIRVDKELVTENETETKTTKDECFQPATSTSSKVYVCNKQLVRPKRLKRKFNVAETVAQDLPSSQLMAYILAEKAAERKKASQTDSVDAFLGGIAHSLKSLNPHLLHEAKGRIFAVVQELELRQLQMNMGSEGHLVSNYVPFSSPSSDSLTSVADASPGYGMKNTDDTQFINLENL